MFLIASGLLFAVFFGNVVIGSMGGPTYLNDIGELLVLLLAAICFTVAILKAEAKSKTKSKEPTPSE